jgi:hypothetical protein
VKRADFLAASGAALASGHPASTTNRVWAAVAIARDSRALLAPFTVTISLHNATGRTVRLRFPTADLFRVDMLRDDTPVWSSVTGHKPFPITRQLDVAPGLLRVGETIVDATTDDHRSLAPGTYTVRVSMLGTNFGSVIDTRLSFDAPEPIAAVLEDKASVVRTISGEQYVDGVYAHLRDASGAIRLSRSLGIRSGTYVVRGFVDAVGDERVFDVGRSAPAFANVPIPSPTP